MLTTFKNFWIILLGMIYFILVLAFDPDSVIDPMLDDEYE